jgi:hypothetical protein
MRDMSVSKNVTSTDRTCDQIAKKLGFTVVNSDFTLTHRVASGGFQ